VSRTQTHIRSASRRGFRFFRPSAGPRHRAPARAGRVTRVAERSGPGAAAGPGRHRGESPGGARAAGAKRM